MKKKKGLHFAVYTYCTSCGGHYTRVLIQIPPECTINKAGGRPVQGTHGRIEMSAASRQKERENSISTRVLQELKKTAGSRTPHSDSLTKSIIWQLGNLATHVRSQLI